MTPHAFNSTAKGSVSDILGSAELAKSRSIASISSGNSASHQHYLLNFFSRVICHLHRHGRNSDGFLHVTVDRLLFITISAGRKPSLLASWNFSNGEISVYGTGRVSGGASGDVESKVFYLVESATAERFIFACDKAVELTSWIRRVTRPASYLYERRWLSSVAAQLGEDQAMLLMPLEVELIRRRVHGASLNDISDVSFLIGILSLISGERP